MLFDYAGLSDALGCREMVVPIASYDHITNRRQDVFKQLLLEACGETALPAVQLHAAM